MARNIMHPRDGWPEGTMCGQPGGCDKEARQSLWYSGEQRPRCDEHGWPEFGIWRDKMILLSNTVALLNSMVLCGESHSDQSRRMVRESLAPLENP